DEDDVALADAIDAPVQLVLGAVAAADVDDLGAADEGALVDDGALAARVDEHRPRLVAAGDDGDELELVDRVLGQLDLALVQGGLVHRLVLDQKLRNGSRLRSLSTKSFSVYSGPLSSG